MNRFFRAVPLFCTAAIFLSCGNKTTSTSPAVQSDDGKPRNYTYRMTGSCPSTWSPTDCQNASDTFPLDYTCDALYEFNMNETKDGFIVEPGMAVDMPEDVTASYAGRYGIPEDAASGYAWKIRLRDDLCWDDGEKIDVGDFIYSAQQFLNPKMKNYRASLLYEDSLPLAGGEEYYNGEGAWEDVGLIKDDDLTFTLVLKTSLTRFMFIYNSSSLSLVKENVYEANKKESGELIKSSYGTSVETSASYGPYKVTAFQADKSMTMSRNDKWRGYHDGKHEGQYQTTAIYNQYIIEHQTIISLFLQGELDETALDAKDLEKYGSSEYRIINPLSYTWKFSFNTDRAALKKKNTAGENHLAVGNLNFRHGISLALDRQKYCDTVTPGSTPEYGLLDDAFIADPERNIRYRDTPEARAALMDFYGIDRYEDITGYDIEAARSCFNKAWNELLASGDAKAGDNFFIDFHTYSNDDVYMRTIDYLQTALNEGTRGTPFEGKVIVRQITDQDYYANMRKGNVDCAMTAWGGSTFDPYGVLWCYCTAEPLHEYGFDPFKVMHTINIDGTDVTLSMNGWYKALCSGTYSSAAFDTRNKILASCEEKLLSGYYMIPVRAHNSNAMLSQRVVEGTDIYINEILKRGGMQYRTYTMDDDEWAAYCEANNRQLQY